MFFPVSSIRSSLFRCTPFFCCFASSFLMNACISSLLFLTCNMLSKYFVPCLAHFGHNVTSTVAGRSKCSFFMLTFITWSFFTPALYPLIVSIPMSEIFETLTLSFTFPAMTVFMTAFMSLNLAHLFL